MFIIDGETMSLKATVLNGKSYHFYWDYSTSKYGIDFKHEKVNVEYSEEGFQEFLQRVGSCLEGCNTSDVGVYIIDLKKHEMKKYKEQKSKGCCQHICCRRKQ